MKEYRRPMGRTWWPQRPAYTRFMVREFTALFVGGYALFLLLLLYRAAEGALPAFVEGLRSPVSVLLHLATLAMAVTHTVTWFHSTPKILVFRRGEKRVSPALILAVQYAAWGLIFLLVAGLVLGAGRG
jgi:fumarate reductase subunit C